MMDKLRVFLKPWAHRRLFPAVEAVWCTLFRLLGIILRPHAQEWSSTGNETVLVIAPHPDDETLGCGGIIALQSRAGDKVYVLIVTDGGRSGAGGLGREEIARRRNQEAREAITALADVDLMQFHLPEGLWSYEELVGKLKGLLTDLEPTVIYTTSCVDFHPEHLRVAIALAEALRATRELNNGRTIRAYELQVPLTPLLANVIADISEVAHLKRRALKAYTTQLPAFLWVPRYARYLRALYRRKGAVELFWEMSSDDFCEMMQREHTRPGGAYPYRSLRLRPFTDVLAWLVGIRERRRLGRTYRHDAHPKG
jgi:LmbE family N-acetylglucosaminyl deacetylase